MGAEASQTHGMRQHAKQVSFFSHHYSYHVGRKLYKNIVGHSLLLVRAGTIILYVATLNMTGFFLLLDLLLSTTFGKYTAKVLECLSYCETVKKFIDS